MKIFQLSRLLLTSALLLWLTGSFAAGNYTGPNRDASGNIVPTPKGQKCVEPTAEMRTNHMKFLLHKRDKTMYKGIRSKQHSLVECINCHVTPDDDGRIARIHDEDNRHFCSSCHAAASVKLDCFECHADRPVETFSLVPVNEVLMMDITAVPAKPTVASNRKVQ